MDRRPVLSVVMPVFKEGEAVEPVLRALTAASPTPHEILVVYDFDEDPTVPVIERLAAELPAVRGLRNDLGRGVLNAMKAGIAASGGPYILISMADGSDEPHVVDSMVALARRRRRRRLGVALHARRPPGRRAAAQAADEPDRGADPALVRRRRRPTIRPTTSSSTRAVSSTRVTIESTAGFELALELTVKATIARPARRRGPDDLARPDRRRRATSSSASGCRTTCTGTGWRSVRDRSRRAASTGEP